MKLNVCIIFVLFTVAQAPPPEKQGCRRPGQQLKFHKRKDNVIDLTYVLDEQSVYWPTNPHGFELVELFKGIITSPYRYFYSANTLRSPEHVGTHIDAPIHFAEHGKAVEEIDLSTLIGRGVLIDLVQDGVRFDKDGLITMEDFLKWERTHGRIRTGSIVLVRTGYGDVYHDHDQYFGTNLTGAASIPELHFPGFDPDSMEWLIKHRCIAAVGLDTPSTDYGQSKQYLTHQILGRNNIPAFENVANLQLLSERSKGFNVIALPMKIKGGTGAATRIIAVLD